MAGWAGSGSFFTYTNASTKAEAKRSARALARKNGLKTFKVIKTGSTPNTWQTKTLPAYEEKFTYDTKTGKLLAKDPS